MYIRRGGVSALGGKFKYFFKAIKFWVQKELHSGIVNVGFIYKEET